MSFDPYAYNPEIVGLEPGTTVIIDDAQNESTHSSLAGDGTRYPSIEMVIPEGKPPGYGGDLEYPLTESELWDLARKRGIKQEA